ncbi:Protein of unknown function [Bacillus cereus]|nr:Protein of unknown function [Bacillus cereus]
MTNPIQNKHPEDN